MTYASVPALRADPALAARLRAGAARHHLPVRARRAGHQVGPARRHVDDREAGRLRRPRRHHRRPSAAPTAPTGCRAQVVHLGADERPVPHPGAGARRAHLLRRCRACCPTAPATPSASSGSSTSSATAPTPRPRSSTTGAVGWRLGEEGRGVATIIEMVSMTRLDCVLGSAALQRAALTEAAHHVPHRSAFGTRLADAPLMQSVIADLALESEAATALAHAAGRRRRPRGARVPAARPPRGQVPGVQAHARPSSPRRWSAWAATASSRSRACRGSTARPR